MFGALSSACRLEQYSKARLGWSVSDPGRPCHPLSLNSPWAPTSTYDINLRSLFSIRRRCRSCLSPNYYITPRRCPISTSIFFLAPLPHFSSLNNTIIEFRKGQFVSPSSSRSISSPRFLAIQAHSQALQHICLPYLSKRSSGPLYLLSFCLCPHPSPSSLWRWSCVWSP